MKLSHIRAEDAGAYAMLEIARDGEAAQVFAVDKDELLNFAKVVVGREIASHGKRAALVPAVEG